MRGTEWPQTEIRIGGFGGQGVILSGIIIGRAAAIHDGKHATLIQSFGPEARGSASSAELIVSDEPIGYPYVRDLDMLVVLSQDAYARFSPKLKKGGLLVTEAELVKLPARAAPTERHFAVPATRLAEEIGRKIVLNIVTVGFFGAVSKLMPVEALEKSVKESVPAGTLRPEPAGIPPRLRGGAGGAGGDRDAGGRVTSGPPRMYRAGLRFGGPHSRPLRHIRAVPAMAACDGGSPLTSLSPEP